MIKPCPNCKNPTPWKIGFRLEVQRYHCIICGLYFTDSDRAKGRPAINGEAMSGEERARRFRLKRKNNDI